jgi:hypothetical protein
MTYSAKELMGNAQQHARVPELNHQHILVYDSLEKKLSSNRLGNYKILFAW